MFLADGVMGLPVEGTDVSTTLWSLAAILFIVKVGFDFYKSHMKTKDHEPPLHKEYVPQVAFDKLEKDIAAIVERNEAAHNNIFTKFNADNRNLRDKMEKVNETLGGLKTSAEITQSTVAALDNKITALFTQRRQ